MDGDKTDSGFSADRKQGRDADWERDLLNRLAFASLNEQRRTRRWNILFKGLFFLYLLALLFMFTTADMDATGIRGGKHAALVKLEGVIADEMEASAERVIKGLRAAFKDADTAGVILRVNSPGGSPVQSAQINREITRLRGKYPDIPLYAVVTDVCASGGYYVAVAAQEIYADESSIVGSIGVRMDSFGLVDAIAKLGIERRLRTAGEHKGFLDPFLPENPEDVAHVQMLLDNIHQQFISVVKAGRGERLKPEPKLFSGLVWTGRQGVELGLVDGLASADQVAREKIGVETIVDFTAKPDFFERFGQSVGVAMARALGGLVEPRATLR